jgi:hypothetical protein
MRIKPLAAAVLLLVPGAVPLPAARASVPKEAGSQAIHEEAKAEEDGPQGLAAVVVGKSLAAAREEEAAAEAARKAAEEGPGSPGYYDRLFQRHFGREWRTAKAICTAESGLDPRAVSPRNGDRWGSRDHGLCQLNDHWQAKYYSDLSELYDPENNVRIMAAIRRGWGGFGAWTTFKAGTYRRYL